jgi:hypothetical protein
VREVVVDGCWRHGLGAAVGEGAHHGGGQVLAPGEQFPWGHRGEPVVAEAGDGEGAEAGQVLNDLGGDLGRADPTDGELEVALDPDRQAIVVGRAGPLQADGQLS